VASLLTALEQKMPIIINGDNNPTAGGAAYGNGTSLAFTAAGTSGQVLVSAGAGAPTWSAIPAVNLATGVTGTLPIANGGTGQTTAQSAINTLAGAVTSGQFLRGNGTNVVMSAIQAADVPTLNQNTTGTASNVTGTVALANGGTGQTTQQAAINALAGAVTSAQFLRGNGTNVVMSAIQASDVPTLNQNTTGTASNVTGTVAIANGGTGASTLAGANIAVTTAANSFTNTQTFTGSSSVLGVVLNDAAEVVTVSATAANSTINYDVTTQSVLFYTSNASGNFTVNIRASSGTSLNTALAIGQSVTVAFLVTNGGTAYYNTTVQVDGTTSGVTTRWQGGTAPTSGNASSVDIYSYTVIKTASATYSVFASQTKFA
jgi:hypothetical protein